MKLLSSIFGIVALSASAITSAQIKLKSNNLTDAVQWDESSLYVNGQPIFLFSGEFHYWRVPSPGLYLDIFQKIRATGYNAISIYFHWGFHSPSPGVFDFETGAHDLQPIFDAAKTAGIWITVRPGPYIHSETSAGGFPGWLVNQPLEVRTNDTAYTEAWKAYISKIGPIIARNQVTQFNGPVILAQIENEYRSGENYTFEGADQYMEDISASFREAGIVVPIFHNDVDMIPGGSWNPRNYPGVLDIYGLDSYPRLFDCANPQLNFNVVTNYYAYMQNIAYGGPSFTPEFQGGANDPWGGPGYEKCAEMVGPEFVDVFYKNNIAQGFTMMSFYMTFGGTNWGHVAAPVVYTSYDYGASINEARLIRDRANESKLLGFFTRITASLVHAFQAGNSTVKQYSPNTAIYVTELRENSSNAGFYIVRSTDTNSTDTKEFTLSVDTSIGSLTLPVGSGNLVLEGRQSKIVVTDYKAGGIILLFSTAEVATWTVVDGKPVILFYVNSGQAAEIAVTGTGNNFSKVKTTGQATVSASNSSGNLLLQLKQFAGKTIVELPEATFIIADRPTAYTFWAPGIKTAYFEPPENQVLIAGPYLIRNATVIGSTLTLVGDVSKDTTLEVFANSTYTSISWNGKSLKTSTTNYGSRTARLSGPEIAALSIPSLNTSETKWKVIDSLPEVSLDYDDSDWVKADKMNSTNQYYPPTTYPNLYAGEYGFHTGNTIYRGRFNTMTSTPTGVLLDIWGGAAFGFTIWLNNEFLAHYPGNPNINNISATYSFSNHTLLASNVLVVLADRMGYARDDGVFTDPHSTKRPRGIRAASLIGGGELTWTLQGNVGGETFDDVVRAPYNEDGLYAERIGAHFNGFDDTAWEDGDPIQGFKGPGVRFYRASIELDFPAAWDVPLGFVMEIRNGTAARVELFVNGWQFGKYICDIGPQTMFPVFPGIIHNQGFNVIGLAVWGQQDVDVKFDTLYLGPIDVLASGYGNFESEGLTPGYILGRKKYEISGYDLII